MSLARVLVIDDNPAEVELIRIALSKVMGAHRFDVLQDGKAALDFVAQHRLGSLAPDPCVIVLDVNLPKHSGFEVLDAVRSSPALDHISVIVTSSSLRSKERARLEELGAFFREKPSTFTGFEELAEFIADVCRGELTFN